MSERFISCVAATVVLVAAVLAGAIMFYAPVIVSRVFAALYF
jgi:hypothetical protein